MENTRQCIVCNISKNLSEFTSFIRNEKLYYSHTCKECKRNKDQLYYIENKSIIDARQKEYILNNSEKVKKSNSNYYLNNRDKILEQQKEYNKLHQDERIIYNKIFNENTGYFTNYRKENKEKLNKKRREWENNRLKTEPTFKLRKIVSREIRGFLKKKNVPKNKSISGLSYTMDELKKHLENQFESWMTWQNWGIYNKNTWDDNDSSTWTWQIDHIIPHSTFNYTSIDDDNFKKCWALGNLRPLSAKENYLDGINKTRHK